MKAPFELAERVLKRFIDHGYEAYIVGGAVRNWLLGLSIHDIDIATSAKPEEVIALFPSTFPVGIEHGTVLVRHDHVDYEVTTFRTEGTYSDFRHPQHVTFIGSLEEDLARRDFTMNAMARDISGVIIDPFHGRQHLKKRLLRTVGQAEARFLEDPLRMLRAARFVSQLNVKADSEVIEAMQKQKCYIQRLSIERVLQEMSKLLQGHWVLYGLELLMATNVLFELPMLSDVTPQERQYLLSVDFNRCASLAERWATFLLALERAAPAAFLKKWRFSNALKNQILLLMQNYHCYKEAEWTAWNLYRVGLHQALAIQRLRAARHEAVESVMEHLQAMAQALPIQTRADLVIDGHDLQAWLDQPPGPWIKGTLANIEQAVVEKQLPNERAAIKRWVKACHEQKKKP